MATKYDELADGFYGTLLGGNPLDCARYFTDNAVVWHNHDMSEKSFEEAFAAAAAAAALSRRFTLVERLELPNGWLQQHRFEFSFPDGQTLPLAAIHRVHVRDDLIDRIDEYMDSAQVGAVIAHAQTLGSPQQ